MKRTPAWGVYRDGIGLVSTARGMTEAGAKAQADVLTRFNGAHATYRPQAMFGQYLPEGEASAEPRL